MLSFGLITYVGVRKAKNGKPLRRVSNRWVALIYKEQIKESWVINFMKLNFKLIFSFAVSLEGLLKSKL